MRYRVVKQSDLLSAIIKEEYGTFNDLLLAKILENLPVGNSELMCHPGLVSKDLKSFYSHQRELELDTLTSPVIKQKIRKVKIQLINWKEL